ncbi:MAG: hypothetical protein AB7E70_18180 [Hyphomicrobiaceae bacterium]
MSAVLLKFPSARAADAASTQPNDLAERMHFWSGASGRAYVHTTYTLFECPKLPACVYTLVRREADGRRTAILVGRTERHATSLNLAEIRQLAARHGANEVDVHLIAANVPQRELATYDLRAGQFACLAHVPPQSPLPRRKTQP